MAKKKRYGQTWWGKLWLSNLLQLEYDRRRHKRGRSYASKGAVTALTFTTTGLTAKVTGSEGQVYEQLVQFERYSEATQKQIIAALQDNWYNLVALGNGDFTRSLERDLEAGGVLVFPRAPLDITCSCPDGAIACKHLLGVFYLAANVIDRQPSLLFSSRGLDLEAELASKIPFEWKLPIPKLLDYKIKAPDNPISTTSSDWAINLPQLLPANDYEALLEFLPQPKLIYVESDFRDLLTVLYERLEQHLVKQRQQLLGEYQDQLHAQLKASEAVGLEVNEQGQLEHIFLQKQGNIVVLHHPQQAPLDVALNLLKTTENTQLDQYPPSWAILVHSYRLAQQMALTGYLWPQLVQVGEGYTIAWRALEGVEVIQTAQQTLLEQWPEHLLALENAPLPKAAQLKLWWHWCWQYWVEKAAARWRHPKRVEDAAIWEAFVTNYPIILERPEGQGLEQALQHWLAPLAITQARFWPVLQVEQAGNGQLITLKWRDQQDPVALPILWEAMVQLPQYQGYLGETMQTLYQMSQQLAVFEELLEKPSSSTVFCGQALYEAVQTNLWPKWRQLGIEIVETKA